MSEADVQRDLGRLEAQVASLGNAVAHLTNKIDALDAKLGEVDRTLSEAKGGWRTLLWIAGAAGSIGSALTYLASYLHLPRP